MSLPDPLIGSQLGDYRIVDLLGRGGMARVYRGYDERLDRYAAVKVIDAQLATEGADEYRQRFLREARAIARLNHPNIVGVYQFGEVDSVYYMAMAFVPGRDLGYILREYARKGRLLAYRDILRVMRDIASALDHAHAGGVIHRDVKPSNIMVAADGHAVLTDFGLALTARDSSAGNTFGSAHYIAPEQAISSAAVVPQSDLYSLGVVLYQLLVGRVPFEDPSATAVALKHLNEPPPAPRQLNPAIPREVEAVVLRLLAKDPARRYKSGKAMLRALERAFAAVPRQEEVFVQSGELALAVAQGRVPTRPTATSRPVMQAVASGRDRRWNLLLVVAGLAVLVAGVVLATLLSEPGATTPTETAASMLFGGVVTATAPAHMTAETPVPPTVTPTVTPTNTPTSTATPTLEPTATQTATIRPTSTAAATAASRVSAVVTVTATPVNAAVELRYDADSLVLYNPSAMTVDVSNLVFVQSVGEDSPLVFRSNVWRDAARLKPGACFQVWTDRYIDLAAPSYCHPRQSWQAVSFVRWFWLSQDVTASFEVRRADAVLARCSVLAGACTVRLPDESAAE